MQTLDVSIPALPSEDANLLGGSMRTQATVSSAAERMWQDSVGTARWGEPSLHLQELGERRYSFQLRSRVNVPLLVGGPMVMEGEVGDVALALLALCAQENSLRVDSIAGGFYLSVVDASEKTLGQSEMLASEPLARAMKRLIVTQAQRAQVKIRSV